MAGIRKTFAVIGCTILSGCLVGPDFKAPDNDAPDHWFHNHGNVSAMHEPAQPPVSEIVEAKPIDIKWWDQLNDPLLSKLVARIAKENLDVQTATIRVRESRAQVGVTAAGLFPQVNANASYNRIKESDKGAASVFGGSGAGGGGSGGGGAGAPSVPVTTKIPPFSLYQYGFDATWEIDLWGRVRRGVEAADATLQASEETRRATQLSAIAELVKDYVQLRAAQASVQVSQKNLDAANEFAHLTEERVKGGLTNEIDLANAVAQSKAISAQLPQLEQQQAQLMNAIALLLAQQPGALEQELATPEPIPPVPPQVPVGVPSELLERRPDIREASAELHAATAEIGVAKADFFPRITLMGNGEMQALHFQDLGDWAAHSYTFGPTIELPLFRGGRLVSTLKLRKDEQKEAAIKYRKTVVSAFHEVDNAMTALRKEQQRHQELLAAVAQNQKALKLANERYKNGLGTYLDFLTAEQSLQNTQLQTISSEQNVMVNAVQLYKTLGGGWENDFPDKNAPDAVRTTLPEPAAAAPAE